MRKTRAEVEKIVQAVRQLRDSKPQPTFEEIAKMLHLTDKKSGKQIARYYYLLTSKIKV